MGLITIVSNDRLSSYDKPILESFLEILKLELIVTYLLFFLLPAKFI